MLIMRDNTCKRIAVCRGMDLWQKDWSGALFESFAVLSIVISYAYDVSLCWLALPVTHDIHMYGFVESFA